jgi:hypothetical protein
MGTYLERFDAAGSSLQQFPFEIPPVQFGLRAGKDGVFIGEPRNRMIFTDEIDGSRCLAKTTKCGISIQFATQGSFDTIIRIVGL